MRTAQIMGVTLLAALASFRPVHAHPNSPATTPAVRAASVAMTGEIVDPQCYFMHDSRGLEHAACATRCARGGQGLAFLDERTGKVYPLIAAGHGAHQNDKVLPHVGKRVAVRGLTFTKGQDTVLQVQSVAVAKAR